MKKIILVILIGGVIIGVGTYFIFIRKPINLKRSLYVSQWLSQPTDHAEWTILAGSSCGNAPFIFPTTGMVGYLWGDSFQPGHHHQGIDIFGGKDPGLTPVYSVYPGYLTRLPDWKSTVIIRIPSDPLQPDRQIWTYYTHMSDSEGNSFVSAEFPAGTIEKFIPAGTLLGYQGNYSGTPDNPVGVHLHFSIVLDDGNGSFRNELKIENTVDPSPYFNLALNASLNQEKIPFCNDTVVSATP
jgi:murein DD-endopeptidase MepM/ murein hydrolase activator NlpD